MASFSPISTKVSVVLNNGTTASGGIATKTINAGGGCTLKSSMTTAKAYSLATAVKALYSQALVRYTRTDVVELTA